jgi:hypothetical protein
MASSTSSFGRIAYSVGPKAKDYLEKKAEEIRARGDGITDMDIWEAWKATKISKVTLKVSHRHITSNSSLTFTSLGLRPESFHLTPPLLLILLPHHGLPLRLGIFLFVPIHLRCLDASNPCRGYWNRLTRTARRTRLLLSRAF